MSVYTDDFSTLPAPNSIRGIRIYVDDTQYWAIDWVMFAGASDLTVDREGAAIVGATLNPGLVVSAEGRMGSITLPGEAEAWWPAAEEEG